MSAWIAQRKSRYPRKDRIEAVAIEFRKQREQDMEAKKKQQEQGQVKKEGEGGIEPAEEELREKRREKKRLKNARRKARRAQKAQVAVESALALQRNASKVVELHSDASFVPILTPKSLQPCHPLRSRLIESPMKPKFVLRATSIPIECNSYSRSLPCPTVGQDLRHLLSHQ